MSKPTKTQKATSIRGGGVRRGRVLLQWSSLIASIASHALVIAIGVLLTSCADSKLIRNIDDNVTVSSKETAESLYEKAAVHMYMTNFKLAANGFAFVQEQFPYSKWALQAQIMEGFCRYQAHQYEDAIDLFTIFSKLHPRHEDAPYALYMIGLCNYERTSIVERDQKDAHEALKAFRKLRKLFPASDYAKDAKFKIDFILNHLAAQEMSIGRFYQLQGALIAAIGRFRNVIVMYPNTEQRPEALLRLAECYATLNMTDEFLSTYEILRVNHADSVWFKCATQIDQRIRNNALGLSSKGKKKGRRKVEPRPGDEASKPEDVVGKKLKEHRNKKEHVVKRLKKDDALLKNEHMPDSWQELQKVNPMRSELLLPRYFEPKDDPRKENPSPKTAETK
ncbi:MAG: outer membrane protein assembly factor BamD [Holosporales bacterium]|jgi:outer membrane protein assembly factor BamD|nr:outer membrane protein assembly factor BamD [Holosporales bacterium]